MPAPWPQWLTNSFLIANHPDFANDESAYNGPYTRLLYHLFGIEGPFEISHRVYHIPQTPGDTIDVVGILTVELNKRPVLFIEVNPPSSFHLDSERKQADDQMRVCFRDLQNNLVTPHIPAISAFGTRVAFYEYTAATKAVTPPATAADPIYQNDVAPSDRWNYDILEADGIARMRQVAQDVRALCEALNN